jgi:signal transduction histidine kinase
VKFADGTDVEVSVRCEPAARRDADSDAAQYELTLVVSDSGRGMSADECTRVWEPYFRSPSHRGGGTGLGA